MTVILDYGMGNLRSVQKAVEFLGHECRIQSDLKGATRVIIPGVGAFAEAMKRLKPVRSELDDFVSEGYVLGICLGYQLLFDGSEEHGGAEGLGYLPGKVKYLPIDKGVKVPHVGWAPLQFTNGWQTFGEFAKIAVGRPSYSNYPGKYWLFDGVKSGSEVYFVHSLYTELDESGVCATATAKHGIKFVAAAEEDFIVGVQFHPEKSGKVGLKILRNFLEW